MSIFIPATRLDASCFWRISIPGANRPEYVGIVEAPDQQSAEAAAVKKFKLSDDDRKRLVVRTRD